MLLTATFLAALEPVEAGEVAQIYDETIAGRRAGPPIAPFFSHMDEATFWAMHADVIELRAYAVAIIKFMKPDARANFLAFVKAEYDQ